MLPELIKRETERCSTNARQQAGSSLANKLARIAWSVLHNATHLTPRYAVAAANSSRMRHHMERIKSRTLSLVAQMVARQPVR